MQFDPFLAEHRFGYGNSPRVAAATGIAEMLSTLTGEDAARTAFPIPPFRTFQEAYALRRRFYSYARKFPETSEGKEAFEKSRNILNDMRRDYGIWFTRTQLRRITLQQGFRERLTAFWADHFTAQGMNGLMRMANPLYVEEAVRPYIAGDFSTLLTACITHPLMLHYLDQNTSVGPNSRVARRRDRRRGLNENLAREVLELHTLGVQAPYQQGDVRELAMLFTGLGATRNFGFKFRPNMVEPGGETVLGKTYPAKGGMAAIREVLQDLADHPATAAHIARKLAVHFVSDNPPEDLVVHITAAYKRSKGNLSECYAALLEHPLAWQEQAPNMRPPDEFVSATMRALGVTAETLQRLDLREVRNLFFRPLQLMGQPWLMPAGPDGFAEDDQAWVTPQGISARLEWAVSTPARLVSALPDPREFVRTALGGQVPQAVAFAANAAESREVAIGLILTSPAFQRR
ncbi:DUF1800 domain-containing protein [Sulfitobacter sp. F26204]|uniref:DUF1800 domain-containing protein n=1 Tax=Sulfitobacter sp. F26204 TaxID=2996014 RepID=UPI00225E3D6D|nr:DUF1800 domain-containing protein [Sulfitobacter sp. F26204]MCX7560299.1 DUF1800 domain-containing protein [Sulfitobacter sp. F26204]